MGTVEGTNNDDLIDINYLDDPDGDVIDGGTGTGEGGGPNDDIVEAYGGNDKVFGGAGNDEIYGGVDDDQLYGGDDNDILNGNDGQDILYGEAGNDELYGGDGNDLMFAGAGEDFLDGNGGEDWLKGQGDKDWLVGGYGDTIDGGYEGDDVDILDLRGLGDYRIENERPDVNGNGFGGTVVFLDDKGEPNGKTLEFDEIEYIKDDKPENRPPDAVNDEATVEAGSSVDVEVLFNDTDPDGDDLTVVSASANNGSVSVDADGIVTYTPNDGFSGPDIITYTIEDPAGLSDTAYVKVKVTDPNSPPDAVDDNVGTVVGGSSITIPVLGNDSDPDGDPIEIISATAPNGTVTFDNTDGTLTYTPEDGFNGPAELTYTITDNISGTDTASVFVNVNLPPDAVDDVVGTVVGGSSITIPVLGNDTDPDGDPLEIISATAPNGTVTFDNTDGTLTYTPDEGFNGPAELTYTITDNVAGTDTASVFVNVNLPPDAVDDVAGTVNGGSSITIPVLGNDTDPDGDPIEITAASAPNGTVTFDNAAGTVTYTPNDGYTGPDQISYTITDNISGSDTAFVSVNVNQGPDAVDDDATVDEGASITIPVLANDTDPEDDDLTVISATATNGDVVINDDGTLTYTPDPDYDGPDEITYTIEDAGGLQDTAVVRVTVTPGNSPPVAVDDPAFTTIPGETTVIPVLANDSDPDGDPIRITSATAANGVVAINPDGTLSYTPNDGFSGDDVITYTITDDVPGNATSTATVPVTVRDGTVEGTNGDDLIDDAYAGDPEGDFVDNDDAILPGDVGNDDLIYGYQGDDSILADDGDDRVFGGQGNDTISGGDGSDRISGGNGNDVIDGDAGRDFLNGDRGDDVLRGGAGDDVIRGGDDDDTLLGNGGDDVILGQTGDDSIRGGIGDDTLGGGTGDDTLDGGDGDDRLIGGYGDDSIRGADGNDVIRGGDGDDYIDSSDGNLGAFDYPYPPLPADGDRNDDLDLVIGGAGNDTIFTGDDRDSVGAGRGDDFVDAGIDDDTVAGGAGDDTIIGGEGNDIIFGQLGDDLIFGGLDLSAPDAINIPDDAGDLLVDNNRDLIRAGQGNDTVYGMDDDDTIYGQMGDDLLYGGVDDDEIWAGIGRDTVYGGHGNDVIRGQGGADSLYGGDGNDWITGGVGNDVIVGGDGVDTLFGRSDRDTFIGGNGGDSVNGGQGGDDFDTLDLRGVAFDSITYTSADREDGFVTFGDGSVLTFEEIENVVPCFTPGTTIATPRGERLVEELREGDRIITRDNGIQEIRWVGRKDITGKTLVASPHLKPVLIKAGSLGNGLPERDMMVSPNHRILVSNDRTQLYFEESEVLAAAKHLVGTEGIHEVDVMSTAYIHFMFDRHEVVLSNGAWTESFQPGDYSLKGIGNAQRNEIIELFPELSTKEGLEGYQSARKLLKKHEARLLVR